MAILLLVGALAGCSPSQPRVSDIVVRALSHGDARGRPCRGEVSLTPRQMNHRSATDEAKRLKEEGRTVLLAVYGLGVGIPQASWREGEQRGCLVIAGTSDEQSNDGGFNRTAGNYASAWNAEMLKPTTP